MNKNKKNVKNSFIVAMPQLSHTEFRDSVIFVCKHDKESSVGFVINQPVKDFSIYSLATGFRDVGIQRSHSQISGDLLWGGDVDAGHLWIIHSIDQVWPHTVRVNRHCGVTANMGTIDDIVSNKRTPKEYLCLTGRMEWPSGVLEKELHQGLWLSVPFDKKILFSPFCQWDALMGRLGVDRLTLSSASGSA